MKRYLVTYQGDCGRNRETVGAMMHLYEIACLYGFSDCTGVQNIRVFQLANDGTPVEVDVNPVLGTTAIQLVDRETRKILDSCGWPNH